MRVPYDLSHYSHVCGKIGRLQTISVIPTVAGDSFEIDLDGIVRLSPFRKEVVSETQVDLLAFYVPHRHVYGDTFVQMVRQGHDEAVTLPSFSLNAGERDACYIGYSDAPASIPLWVIEGYNRIWDRYFRVPSFDPDANFQQYPTGTTQAAIDYRRYGRLCARLPHPLVGGIQLDNATAWRDLNDNDSEFEGEMSGGKPVIDVRNIAFAQALYKSEIERTWFGERYNDILDIWGSSVNIDADQRPEMIWRETFNLSGADVDGHDDATIGSYIGKTVGRADMRIPRKYFPEHGAVWIMALLRFPLVHVGEAHLLMRTPNPTGQVMLGDPTVWAETPPVQQSYVDWLGGYYSGSLITGFYEPYGSWYRMHCSRIHRQFADIPGYPFSKVTFTTPEELYYHQPTDYNDVFQTSQLGHWQIHSMVRINALRHIPDPKMSIFAGAQ